MKVWKYFETFCHPIIFSSFIILYYELNKLQLKSSLCYRQKYDLIFTNEACNASLTISSQKFDILYIYRQVRYKTAQYSETPHVHSLKIINNYKTVLLSAHPTLCRRKYFYCIEISCHAATLFFAVPYCKKLVVLLCATNNKIICLSVQENPFEKTLRPFVIRFNCPSHTIYMWMVFF